jgi:hypothetical protein
MFEDIPDYEFKNLTRSTLPLLAWWKDKAAALELIGEKCGFDDLADALVCFEFSTASAGPHDKASYTDVMVESRSTAIAIEGKWTEPRHETVSEWSQNGNTTNRQRVLAHWLSLIRNRAAKLDDSAIQDIPYQMLHRTASACARMGKLPVVLYQVFRDEKHVTNYGKDLQQLARAPGQTDMQVWLLEIPSRTTEVYQQVASKAANIAPQNRHVLTRRAVCEQGLFIFGACSFRRIACQ